jgi:DNA-binding response OmpR family regulator
MDDIKISDISVLIAEDETKLLHSMVEYLQLFFTHVYAAEDGLMAYEIYEEKRPDIIVADIHMPHLDGLSMIKKIRQNDQETKIIITTAHSDTEKLLQAIELHLVKYLVKPVQSDQLKELLFSIVKDLRSTQKYVHLKEGFRWDIKQHKLFGQGEEIVLKPKEQKVLELLFSKKGEAVSAKDIYGHLYPENTQRTFSPDAITSLIKRIRQKLPKDTIKSSYGVGYMLQTA